jgi:hypothetical protein
MKTESKQLASQRSVHEDKHLVEGGARIEPAISEDTDP